MPTYRITAQHMRDDLRNASFVEAASDSDAVKQVGRQLDDAHYYVVSCDHAAPIIERDLRFWSAEVERLDLAISAAKANGDQPIALAIKRSVAAQIRDGLADYFDLIA